MRLSREPSNGERIIKIIKKTQLSTYQYNHFVQEAQLWTAESVLNRSMINKLNSKMRNYRTTDIDSPDEYELGGRGGCT